MALDKRTGNPLWRHRSPVPGQDDIYGTWSTPFVVEIDGRPRVISALRGELAALDAGTGRLIWSTDRFGIQAKSSPVAGEGVVVLSGDKESREIAVRLGGAGNVGETHLLWQRDPPKRRIGTGIIHKGHVFGVQTPGIVDCVALDTGRTIWEERLSGPGANRAVWSSPILAGDRIYVMNQSGDVFVYRSDPESFVLLATNSLAEPANASVVPAHGHLFLRTHEALWCIGDGRLAAVNPIP